MTYKSVLPQADWRRAAAISERRSRPDSRSAWAVA